MRSELSNSSATIATLKHGERLEVLQTRRRLVKVRNMGTSEGWVDSRFLLSTQQMADLQQTIIAASKLPSLGKATVFDALNMHTEPNRQSPSPFQIPAGGSVEVVAHKLQERAPYLQSVDKLITTPKPSIAPRKKKAKGKGKSKKEELPDEEVVVPPPPMPAPPRLPENWQELSKTEFEEEKSLRADDWSMVRLQDKKAGWVLSRMLYMSIPDEVAQYAQGKRITSYFSLGKIQDEEKVKEHWMYTLAKPRSNADFDSVRVLIYTAKRHRYETVFRDNDLKGFFPVLQSTVSVTENKKTMDVPGFSYIVEDENGDRWKKTYAFLSTRVKAISKESLGKPRIEFGPMSIPSALPPPPPPEIKKSWIARVRSLVGK